MSILPNTAEQLDLPQADATMLCDYLHCKRYGYWRHERGWESVDTKLPLVYGISIHAMLAEWHKTHDLKFALAAFDQSWTKHGEPDGDQKRNPRRAADIMAAYIREYPTEPFTVIDTEVVGALPAGKFILVVIIDLVADFPNYGLLPIDHKTTSYLNDGWWAGMNPKHQYSGYLWAMRQLFGKNCNNLYVNAILVDRTKCLFQRRPTGRSDWELTLWLEQMNHLWSEVELCRAMNIWPQNDDYCTRWGGRPEQICQFHSLCTTVGVDYRQLELSPMQFKQSKWDPLHEVR